MILGVIGTEHFKDYNLVEETLFSYDPDRILTTKSDGTHELASRFASRNFVPCTRNKLNHSKIIKKSDELVFFWDSKCEKTKDAIDESIELNKSFRLVDIETGKSIFYNG